MCVCVCVCTDSFQAGFPNRSLCIFCTFLRYFRRVPTHMQPKSVSCSSPLVCSSRLALDLCTAVIPSTASVPMPRFGWNQQTLTEHCWTRQAPSERQLRMSGCLWCLFGRMCSFSVQNGATRGVTVSMSAFLACHQCYCAGSSLAWDLNLRAVVCDIF